MSFFSEGKVPVDTQCGDWARQLMGAVKRVRKYLGKSSLAGWARSFAQLRKQESPEEIQKCLNWYCQHIGEEYVPEAHSGKAFRDKFSAIQRKAREHSQTEESVISEMDMSIANSAMDLKKYPPEIVANLSAIVHYTQDNWTAFVHKIRNQRDLTDRDKAFLGRVLALYAHTFVLDWILFLGDKYGRMEHYTGAPLSLTFKSCSVMFRDSFWHKWAYDWCGTTTAFDTLYCDLTKTQEKS